MKRLAMYVCGLFIISGAMLSIAAPIAFAYDPLDDACTQYNDSPTCKEQVAKDNNPLTGNNGILIRIAQLVALVTGIAAVIATITAGISYITSAGDPQKAERAKSRLKGALIGMVIAALAVTLVTFVVTKL